ncbi:DUF1801 domain-containing protein [Maribellus sp. CM-23]|uniref:DUF1801 domain-containing protein n=1 Tax=Maribellus sp. CM-23 TaxID=2781026 RepID=UPI001F1FC63D|nr:DUF1801 domain-containing protein [Maribellus sp. CM-23]MCE4565413.1 DUF1801 domain-containing protein [Maribellus sp. CM-23]
MKIEAHSPEEYIAQVPEERKAALHKLRQVIRENLPEGFQETISYGMIGFVVPHSLYPAGYHVNPAEPLPFISLASQKNFMAVYHFAMYADPGIYDWFVGEYPKHSKTKLDMGKSCIRFKKPGQIPFDLLGELAGKLSPEQWIELYESKLKK